MGNPATLPSSKAAAILAAPCVARLAAPCVARHETDGISPNPQWPSLAGHKDQHLISSLKAYRNGDRSNPIMAPLAKGLCDEDIENLAACTAGL